MDEREKILKEVKDKLLTPCWRLSYLIEDVKANKVSKDEILLALCKARKELDEIWVMEQTLKL